MPKQIVATCSRLGGLALLALLGATRVAGAQSWEIPAGASSETSPLASTPAVLAKGSSLYLTHCGRCHGKDAKGDGPDKTNDSAHRPPDLTSQRRAAINTDGVMFYKIWNGREQPTMPAFRTKLSKDDVWSIVEYVKSLRDSSR